MSYHHTSLQTAPRLPIPLDARVVHKSDSFEVVHLTLLPGEGMDLHEMPFPVVFFVREGLGTLRFENEEVQGNSGDCIRVEPGVKRGWKNTGSRKLKIVVMKLLKC
jgi:quercetin dioxygenase-like cupin family protein